MIFRSIGNNPPMDRDNSSSSIGSRKSMEEVPYHHLLKEQLFRFRPHLKGDFGLNDKCTFFYNEIPIVFDFSDDCHTFMVWSVAYKVNHRDDQTELEATFRELEDEFVDTRLEWNDEDEITLYQNLPICLVQEDYLGEFQAILGRFLQERVRAGLTFFRASSHERSMEKKSTSQKSLSLRNLFGAKSA